MKQKTTLIFATLTAALATSYAVASVGKQFSVEPSVEQILYDQIYETSEFLQMIDTQMVDDLVGQPITLSVSGGITSRAGVETDPAKKRQPKNVLGLDDREYRLYPTECDVYIPWHMMDKWAKFPDFAKRFRAHVKQQMALDIIKIGFHGITAAAVSDPDTYSMGEDVNIGWLQLVRRDRSVNALDGSAGTQKADEIRIGEGGDYENLDCAVHDLLQGIPEHKRTGMVAIIGADLLAKDKGRMYETQAHTPSEKGKIELKQVIETYGSLPSYKVSFFPTRGVMVTSFDNLQYLIQEGSTRVSIKDNQESKRVEDFNSRNDGYFIADLDRIIFFESANVKLSRIKDPAVLENDFDATNPLHYVWS